MFAYTKYWWFLWSYSVFLISIAARKDIIYLIFTVQLPLVKCISFLIVYWILETMNSSEYPGESYSELLFLTWYLSLHPFLWFTGWQAAISQLKMFYFGVYCSSTDFENPKIVNKMFGIFQGTVSTPASTQQVQLHIILSPLWRSEWYKQIYID